MYCGSCSRDNALAVELLARGHDVWVYDNLSAGHRAAVPADRLLVGDLSERDRLDQTLV
jgi:UDP-glucose 4-epimerase